MLSVGGAVARVPVVMGTGTIEVRVSATGLVTGKLAGAILQADLERSVHPALLVSFGVGYIAVAATIRD